MKRLLKWLLRLIVLVLVLGGAFAHHRYFRWRASTGSTRAPSPKFAVDSPEMLSSMRILPGWMDFYGDKLDDASPATTRRWPT